MDKQIYNSYFDLWDKTHGSVKYGYLAKDIRKDIWLSIINFIQSDDQLLSSVELPPVLDACCGSNGK